MQPRTPSKTPRIGNKRDCGVMPRAPSDLQISMHNLGAEGRRRGQRLVPIAGTRHGHPPAKCDSAGATGCPAHWIVVLLPAPSRSSGSTLGVDAPGMINDGGLDRFHFLFPEELSHLEGDGLEHGSQRDAVGLAELAPCLVGVDRHAAVDDPPFR